MLIPGTKKEDLLKVPGTKKEDFLEGQFASPKQTRRISWKDNRTSWRARFAYLGDKEGGQPEVCLSGDKEGGLPGGPVCFLGTKKEDFLEGQFAFPGDEEGGLPGGPVCLSRGDKEGGLPGGPVCFSREQRRRTSWEDFWSFRNTGPEA